MSEKLTPHLDSILMKNICSLLVNQFIFSNKKRPIAVRREIFYYYWLELCSDIMEILQRIFLISNSRASFIIKITRKFTLLLAYWILNLVQSWLKDFMNTYNLLICSLFLTYRNKVVNLSLKFQNHLSPNSKLKKIAFRESSLNSMNRISLNFSAMSPTGLRKFKKKMAVHPQKL